MSLLAIDIGSSRCKAVLFSDCGRTLAKSFHEYSPEFPQPSFAEIDVETLWNAFCASSRAVASQSANDPVQAICIASHGETFVPVGRDGRPLTPAILNMDSRATAQAAFCERSLGRRRVYDITGLVVHSMFPIPKILWLKENRPDVFSAAERFLCIPDYLLTRLGLPPYIDFSLGSRFLAFDVRRKRWSDEILSAVGISADQLPIPVPSGNVAGKLTVEAAASLGVKPGTLLVVGGHDQPCGALGVGVIAPGRVSDSLGTYECLVAASDRPTLDDSALAACLNSYCHVVPDQFVTLAYFPSGIAVKWLYDLFRNYAGEHTAAERETYSRWEAAAPAGPSGLCVLPHLIGTCNPDFNPHARGTIFGITPGTTAAQIYKGTLEGVACELAQLADILARTVGDFRDIYVIGGGASSQLGLKLRAALTGRRLHVMRCQEAVCLGAAILAGVAARTYSSIADAVRQVVCGEDIVEPDPAIATAYAPQVRRYRSLYPALAGTVCAASAQGGEQ